MTRALLLALLSACRSSGPDGKESGAPDSGGGSTDSTPTTVPCGDPMDLDADGYPDRDAACGVVDCDDADPARFPGASDTPEDGVDQDCDGDDDCGYGPPLEGDLQVSSAADAEAFCAAPARALSGSLVVYGVGDLTDLTGTSTSSWTPSVCPRSTASRTSAPSPATCTSRGTPT